jgi:hypothetical protein
LCVLVTLIALARVDHADTNTAGGGGLRAHVERIRSSQRGGVEARQCARVLRALGDLRCAMCVCMQSHRVCVRRRRSQPDAITRSLVPRARHILIRFLDRTEREFIVDDARPVQHIALLVGNQMGLRNAEVTRG